MLLLGPPGIGKTSICKILSLVLELPLIFIPLGSSDSNNG